MLDQLKGLSSAIDTYKAVSEGGDFGGMKIDEVIMDAVGKIWNILGDENTSIQIIIDSFDRMNAGQNGEYKGRIALMQRAYIKGDKSEFINQMLSLFGFSNPEMFISRGRICPIVNPLIGTKIKVSVILRCEKEIKRKKPKAGSDLEGISAIISTYNSTYGALVSKKTGIQNIIHDELIMPLAEDAPFIQRKYGLLITLYEKKEGKLSEITDLERKIGNLQILKKRGMTNGIKKAELQISKKMIELADIIEQIQGMKDPFFLDDIVIYIQRKFGNYIKKKKIPMASKSDEVVTSHKIKGKIRRGISIGVHRNEELKKIRVNAGSMIRMIKMYEKIIEKYTKISSEIDDPKRRLEVAVSLREELDAWEIESNALMDIFSISDIRRLRDQVIEQLLSKK